MSRYTSLYALICICVSPAYGIASEFDTADAGISTVGGQTTAPVVMVETTYASQPDAISTLQADYTVESKITVAGHQRTFAKTGRILIDGTSLCIVREVLPGVPEAQVIYRDGICKRYFPFSQYGHQIPASSWDKHRSEFAKYWRPLMMHLYPATQLDTVQPKLVKLISPIGQVGLGEVADDVSTLGGASGQGVALQGGTEATAVSIGSTASVAFHNTPDVLAELASRPDGSWLEYWGPRPKVTMEFSPATNRLMQMNTTQYSTKTSSGNEPEPKAFTTCRLGTFKQVSGISVPTKLDFTVRSPSHLSPYSVSTVQLDNIKVDVPLPPDAFEPIWPSDAILLDVETPAVSSHAVGDESVRTLIMKADWFLGTGDLAQGLEAIAALRKQVAGRRASAFEISNIARLTSLAGDPIAGRAVHTKALRELEEAQRLGQLSWSREEYERQRILYDTEYAYFIARNYGGKSHKQAAEYLRERVEKMVDPVAIAKLATRAADHVARIRDYNQAYRILDDANERVKHDVASTRWVNAMREILRTMEERTEHYKRLAAKRAKIDQLTAIIGEIGDQDPRTAGVRAELDRLRTQP